MVFRGPFQTLALCDSVTDMIRNPSSSSSAGLQMMKNHSEAITYLGDSAEVEDTLVFQAGQIRKDIRDVVESVGDEFVQTLHSHIDVLWFGKVRELFCISAPNLKSKIRTQVRGYIHAVKETWVSLRSGGRTPIALKD